MRSILRGAPARGLSLVAISFVFAGCAGTQSTGIGSARDVSAETGPPPEVVACASGATLTRDELGERLLAARAIYVGEQHDRASHHAAQRDIVVLLHALDPSLAIGMEMFEQPYQPGLDAFTSGETDEAQLLVATEWEARWSFDVALYRPILSFAREQHVRIIALNARRELTRTIAREGEDALSEELRAELPTQMDREDAAHRAMVMGLLGEHAHGEHAMDEATLERFYLAQLVWDETMGSRVAQTLSAPDAPRRIVVMAGRVHVQAGLGIPRRAARAGAEPSLVILPASMDELESLRDQCDYVWVVPDEPSPDEPSPDEPSPDEPSPDEVVQDEASPDAS